jgi:hypothetical protein
MRTKTTPFPPPPNTKHQTTTTNTTTTATTATTATTKTTSTVAQTYELTESEADLAPRKVIGSDRGVFRRVVGIVAVAEPAEQLLRREQALVVLLQQLGAELGPTRRVHKAARAAVHGGHAADIGAVNVHHRGHPVCARDVLFVLAAKCAELL